MCLLASDTLEHDNVSVPSDEAVNLIRVTSVQEGFRGFHTLQNYLVIFFDLQTESVSRDRTVSEPLS